MNMYGTQDSKNSISTTTSSLSYEILPSDSVITYDLSIKIIILGDSFVGKTSLAKGALRKKFDLSYNATVGFEYISLLIRIDNSIIRVHLWDTCGQEAYRSLIRSFYRNASLAILVYSIDNIESFNNLSLWLKEVKSYSNPDVKIFVIGNKNDLEEKRQVTKEMGNRFKFENDCCLFEETSAMKGENVSDTFIKAVSCAYSEVIRSGNSSNNHIKSNSKFKVPRLNSVYSVGSYNYGKDIRHDIKISDSCRHEKKGSCEC